MSVILYYELFVKLNISPNTKMRVVTYSSNFYTLQCHVENGAKEKIANRSLRIAGKHCIHLSIHITHANTQ